MNATQAQQFVRGNTYLVVHRETTRTGPKISRKSRRIFKGMEKRFGEIPCAVFTSPVAKDTIGDYDEIGGKLTISGRRLPASELSVPHYDIVFAEPA